MTEMKGAGTRMGNNFAHGLPECSDDSVELNLLYINSFLDVSLQAVRHLVEITFTDHIREHFLNILPIKASPIVITIIAQKLQKSN